MCCQSKLVGTDDTPLKVLDRNLPQTRKGGIWPYVGDIDHPTVIYEYITTRERAGLEEFPKGFRGYLQADAYVVYDSFFDPARVGGVLAMIAHLYEVEKVSRGNGLRGETLRLARQKSARPMLNRLHDYLLTIWKQVPPKSEAGQAITYTLKNWAALTRYCSDGNLSIDNNATERSLRSFALASNNWTFFGSYNGGKTAAVLRSFVSSRELVRVDPFAWFRDILSRIADHPSSGSKNCCRIVGLRQPDSPAPIFPNIRPRGPLPP